MRERLAELGRVGDAEITLADGNQAGRGDLIRARLNTRIDADGQTLANRDVVRVESINDSAFGRLAAVVRQTGPDQWSRPFFVPAGLPGVAPSWPTRATSTSRRAARSTAGTWWSTAAPTRSLVYTGATRGREKNTIHVVTGRAGSGAADPGRAGGLHRRRSIRRAAALRKAGRPDLARDGLAADAGPAQRPAASPVGGDPRPGAAAGRPGADRARGDPGRAGLRRRTPGTSCSSSEAFWHLDVVPQIDEMVRQRITACGVRAVPEGPGAARVPAAAPRARDRRPAASRTCWTPSPPSR